MSTFDEELQGELGKIREAGLLRQLRRIDSPQGVEIEQAGKARINFSSNDYLGFANHPKLKEAAIRAVERFGTGSGASRLICGSLGPHHDLEAALARFKKTEAALSFSSGYAAAIGAICAMVGKEDVIILDKLVHASIVDAAKLSGAKLRIFAHNDLANLEEILQWAATVEKKRRVLIVTESVFSMDGDCARLKELVELKDRHGACLMVDEAHATGIYGSEHLGSGLADELGVGQRIEIQLGTLGKALGAAGGYVCGSQTLIDYLINRARSFIFSTAPTPATAAAAQAGVELCQSAEGSQRRKKLWQSIRNVKNKLEKWPSITGASAIIPLLIGDEAAAMELAKNLMEAGIYLPAIRYPSVARGEARLRLTLTADHTEDQIAVLVETLNKFTGNIFHG